LAVVFPVPSNEWASPFSLFHLVLDKSLLKLMINRNWIEFDKWLDEDAFIFSLHALVSIFLWVLISRLFFKSSNYHLTTLSQACLESVCLTKETEMWDYGLAGHCFLFRNLNILFFFTCALFYSFLGLLRKFSACREWECIVQMSPIDNNDNGNWLVIGNLEKDKRRNHLHILIQMWMYVLYHKCSQWEYCVHPPPPSHFSLTFSTLRHASFLSEAANNIPQKANFQFMNDPAMWRARSHLESSADRLRCENLRIWASSMKQALVNMEFMLACFDPE